MTETIFGKNLFDVCFDFLVWPMSHLLTWRGAGFMTYTAASHQGANEMVWLHFFGEMSCRPSLYTVCGCEFVLLLRIKVKSQPAPVGWNEHRD